MYNQKGFTLWFTGLSGSGKTAIAKPLAQQLRERGLKVERLDGDIVRQSLTRDLGFSKEDRDKNIERVTFVAKLLTRNGVAVICSFISPYRSVRAKVSEEVGNFVVKALPGLEGLGDFLAQLRAADHQLHLEQFYKRTNNHVDN